MAVFAPCTLQRIRKIQLRVTSASFEAHLCIDFGLHTNDGYLMENITNPFECVRTLNVQRSMPMYLAAKETNTRSAVSEANFDGE